MLSVTNEAASRKRGIAGRVARVAVVCAALGGFVAAAIAIVAVDRLISREAELRLRAATVTLAGELDEGRKAPLREAMPEVLDDENDEIASSGIRLAVFEAKQLIAGDPSVPLVDGSGRCLTTAVLGGRVRACSRGYRGWVLVAAQASGERELYWLYAVSLIGAMALGGLTGALSSRKLTRWAVGPLYGLLSALRESRPRAARVLELGTPSDVAEVEEIRAVLARRALEIQALLEQANRFAADAAHELRTPLTVLRAELELMLEEQAGRDGEALRRVITRVERLTELVNRLLILALPTRDLAAGFETVALTEVAEDVLSQLSPLERARVRIEAPTDGLVRGDAELLRSMMTNCLSNALKFASAGEVVVRIDTRHAPESPIPELVVIDVMDGGPGVPAEARERVFEPFYRTRTGGAPGHGLGLALVGHIARVHGGVASFIDAECGAHLEIQLPAWQAASSPSSG